MLQIYCDEPYVLDRTGALYLFEIAANSPGAELSHQMVIDNVGDGNDLMIAGDVLLCSRHGSLEAYTLADPAQPRHLGRFGPVEALSSECIIRQGDLAHLVGDGTIESYDLATPAQPKHLASLKTGRYGWCGCAVDNRLYVRELAVNPGQSPGISVYDTTELASLKPLGFTPTGGSPYHLFGLANDRVLASYDSAAIVQWQGSSRPRVWGNAAILEQAGPGQLATVAEFTDMGGRAATYFANEQGAFLVGNGAVFRVEQTGIKRSFSFDRSGSTLDGAPYHGASDGQYVALATDTATFVLRFAGPVEAKTADPPGSP
jgi:hypothetical protein